MPKSRRRKRKKIEPGPQSRTIKLSPEVIALLKEQKKAFIEKFGREPRANEPVFFDPDADEPMALDPDYVQGQILTAMGAAGVDPAIAYAYRKTGLLLDESLGVAYDPDTLREWREAIAEYRRTHSKAKADPPTGKHVISTELPELLGYTLKDAELEKVVRCLNAIDNTLGHTSTFVMLEVAAALVVMTCQSAFDSAGADGTPEEGPQRYHYFEDLILRRAREIYAQGHG